MGLLDRLCTSNTHGAIKEDKYVLIAPRGIQNRRPFEIMPSFEMLALWIATLCGIALALPPGPPTVKLDDATITGVRDGSVDKFLGIPYAFPPTGPLRFRLPKALGPYEVDFNATQYGPSCPQQRLVKPSNLPGNVSAIISQSPLGEVTGEQNEDCLSLNIVRPSFASAKTRFPIVVWIHGGSFENGNTASHDQMAKRIVERSVAIGSPVIFMSMNYRLSAYGFLASKEVQYEGVANAGLVDQREALHVVQQYIYLFGGDKTRVTLWGESAGAVSVALQLLGEGGNSQRLFHGAFMQSGAPIPSGDQLGGQKYYDFLVGETGCAQELDTLGCLRNVPFNELRVAVDKTPDIFSHQSLVHAWFPRFDGAFLSANFQTLLQLGRVAHVPIVSGNTDDEGTLFSFTTRNITSEVDFREYVGDIWLPSANVSDLQPLWNYYTANTSEGSPFSTGNGNKLTSQFKRLAAFQNDAVFQAPRRYFLNSVSGKQKIWSYLSKRSKDIPFAGSYHGSDLSSGLMDDYLIRFVANHDPNNGTGPVWPEYTTGSPQLYTFGTDVAQEPTITKDDYRSAAMSYLTELFLAHPMN